jgi:hypothetical protein
MTFKWSMFGLDMLAAAVDVALPTLRLDVDQDVIATLMAVAEAFQSCLSRRLIVPPPAASAPPTPSTPLSGLAPLSPAAAAPAVRAPADGAGACADGACRRRHRPR